jgi:hypothetical protein
VLTLLNSPDGKVLGINKKALLKMPFVLIPNAPNVPIAIPAAGPAGPFAWTVSGEGPAQIVSLQTDVNSALIMLKMQEGRNFRELMNGAVNMSTIFGTNRTPYPLCEPLYVDETRRLIANFTGLTAGAVNIRPAAWCSRATSIEADPTLEMARKRQDFRQFLSFPYWYTLDDGMVTLTGTTVFEKVITIGYDHHFMLHQISAAFAGTSEAFGFNIDIIDVAKNESLFYAPQANHFGASSFTMIGDGNYPYQFISPRLFMTGQRILIRVNNNFAGTNTLYLTLHGQAIADRMWR